MLMLHKAIPMDIYIGLALTALAYISTRANLRSTNSCKIMLARTIYMVVTQPLARRVPCLSVGIIIVFHVESFIMHLDI
jgi:hypothetical protein